MIIRTINASSMSRETTRELTIKKINSANSKRFWKTPEYVG